MVVAKLVVIPNAAFQASAAAPVVAPAAVAAAAPLVAAEIASAPALRKSATRRKSPSRDINAPALHDEASCCEMKEAITPIASADPAEAY